MKINKISFIISKAINFPNPQAFIVKVHVVVNAHQTKLKCLIKNLHRRVISLLLASIQWCIERKISPTSRDILTLRVCICESLQSICLSRESVQNFLFGSPNSSAEKIKTICIIYRLSEDDDDGEASERTSSKKLKFASSSTQFRFVDVCLVSLLYYAITHFVVVLI